MRSLSWGVVCLFAAAPCGCGGSDDPGSGDTEASSSSTSDGSTSPVTTLSGSTSGSSSSSTTDEAESSSSSGSVDGSSSSTSGASSSSTGPGCVPGTEDCVCDDGSCDEGLACMKDDVCEVPPPCPQEDSEPNNTEDEAPDLGEFNDFDPAFTVVDGRLPDETDEDWISYRCDDNALGQVDMAYEIDTNIPVRVCQFIECDLAETVEVVCPEGSEDATSPNGFPGCCSELETLTVEEITCNEDGDESGRIYVRVDMPAQNMCVSYDLGVHC